MARVQYSSIVNRIDGKVGGQVLQRCGQSLSLRNKSAVRASQSSKSLATRNQFSQLASLWRGLSVSDKATWETYAPTYPTYDIYGNHIVLTGYQLFMYVNRPMVMAGYTPRNTAVTYVAPPIFSGYVSYVSVGDEEFLIECDGSPVSPNVMLIYATQLYVPPRSITLLKSVYCGKITWTDGSSTDIYDQWKLANPSGLVEGMLVLLEYWWLNTTTGCMVLGNKDEVTVGA